MPSAFTCKGKYFHNFSRKYWVSVKLFYFKRDFLMDNLSVPPISWEFLAGPKQPAFRCQPHLLELRIVTVTGSNRGSAGNACLSFRTIGMSKKLGGKGAYMVGIICPLDWNRVTLYGGEKFSCPFTFRCPCLGIKFGKSILHILRSLHKYAPVINAYLGKVEKILKGSLD